MNNFIGINGDGEFVLYINDEEVDRIQFTQEKRAAIEFNITDDLDNQTSLFIPGENVTFRIVLENFSPSNE